MPAPLLTLILALLAETVLWAICVGLGDVTLADVFWGPGLVLMAGASAYAAPPTDARDLLLLTLVGVWAARLGWHLFARWRRAGREDRRYAAMRAKAGKRFAVRSLASVFWLQGAILWIVSWPLQAAMAAPPVPFGPIDLAGIVLAAGGIVLEGVADYQLARFMENPANHGKVLDAGAWAWSRHPNYFGDAALWWGLFLIALSGSGAWWTVLSPLLMTFILVRVSGVALTEKTIAMRRPGYADYMRRRPAFLPRPPRSGRR